MEAMNMDVEDERKFIPNGNSKSLSRFGLKKSIQTNFVEEYVFQITSEDDLASMAVSLSSNLIKLYSPTTGQYFGECRGHSSAINQISFIGPSTSHVLHSCSSDGTIRSWDTRTSNQVSEVRAGNCKEIFSFAFGGPGDNLLAAGIDSQILFWDWRNRRQVACLEESHVDDVTQVHFVPGHQNKLVSASVDGLICIFQTHGDLNEEDHLESVFNVGTSIGKVGFFGETHQKLWCLTHIETLSVWDLQKAGLQFKIQDARTLASERWNLDHVDYFVDCDAGEGDGLYVMGGTKGGALGLFPVYYDGAKEEEGSIGFPEAVLEGGHTDVVRSVLRLPNCRGGVFGWSGAEDGRLCCWSSSHSCPEINHSWISASMVFRSGMDRQKNRYCPY